MPNICAGDITNILVLGAHFVKMYRLGLLMRQISSVWDGCLVFAIQLILYVWDETDIHIYYTNVWYLTKYVTFSIHILSLTFYPSINIILVLTYIYYYSL